MLQNDEIHINSLTKRELEIAHIYANGATYSEIADRLYIAPSTVRTHITSIYRKLQVSSKIELSQTLQSWKSALAHQRPNDGHDIEIAGNDPEVSHIFPSDFMGTLGQSNWRQIAVIVVEYTLVRKQVDCLPNAQLGIGKLETLMADILTQACGAVERFGGSVCVVAGTRIIACLGCGYERNDLGSRAFQTALALQAIVENLSVLGAANMSCRIGLSYRNGVGAIGAGTNSDATRQLNSILASAQSLLKSAAPGQILAAAAPDPGHYRAVEDNRKCLELRPAQSA